MPKIIKKINTSINKSKGQEGYIDTSISNDLQLAQNFRSNHDQDLEELKSSSKTYLYLRKKYHPNEAIKQDQSLINLYFERANMSILEINSQLRSAVSFFGIF